MRTYFFGLFLAVSFVGLFVSCTDEEEDAISLAGHDTFLDATFYDSLSIKAYTIYVDSMETTLTSSSNYMLGYYDDNVFGKVEASIYTQLSLGSSSSLDLSSNRIDSAVLSLASAKSFPDALNTSFHIQVYRLTEDLESDAKYYSFSTALYESATIGDAVISYSPKDSVVVDNIALAPQMRVRLSDDFAQLFQGKSFSSDADFKSFLKGLYIKVIPASDKGKIAYVSLASVYSCITLYCNANGTSKSYTFPTNNSSNDVVRFCNFKHDYSGTVLNTFNTNKKDSIDGDNQLYLESMAGTRLKIYFPDLLEWGYGKSRIINQATLVLPVSDNTPDTTVLPPSLYYRSINDDGSHSDALGAASYSATEKEYRFYLNSYILNILIGTLNNNGIIISILGDAVEANRCVLNGPLFDGKKMKLEILYTKSPEN